MQIKENDTIKPRDLINSLVNSGYKRVYTIEKQGEVSLRGSILDIFPINDDKAYRLDFFGNDMVSPWGHRLFTEIPYDDHLVADKRTSIAKLYQECMANSFADIDTSIRSNVENKKKEIQQAIMNHMGIIMKSESPKKPQPYNDFVKWTQSAVNVVNEFNPNV